MIKLRPREVQGLPSGHKSRLSVTPVNLNPKPQLFPQRGADCREHQLWSMAPSGHCDSEYDGSLMSSFMPGTGWQRGGGCERTFSFTPLILLSRQSLENVFAHGYSLPWNISQNVGLNNSTTNPDLTLTGEATHLNASVALVPINPMSCPQIQCFGYCVNCYSSMLNFLPISTATSASLP